MPLCIASFGQRSESFDQVAERTFFEMLRTLGTRVSSQTTVHTSLSVALRRDTSRYAACGLRGRWVASN